MAKVQPWAMISTTSGNALQGAGLAGSLLLTWAAGRRRERGGTALLAAGWIMNYFSSHAIAHWAVGRVGGIRFTGYGVHGTTAPDWYPPGVSWLFAHAPFLSARTEPASRRAAPPAARAALYAAGPLWTVLTSLGLPLYGVTREVPRAKLLLGFAALWLTPMVVVETIREGGAAEVPAHEVGLAILAPLKDLDEVAYLRFASVYKSFDDLADFEDEIVALRASRAPVIA